MYLRCVSPQSPRFTENCLVESGNTFTKSPPPPPLFDIVTPPASTEWESPSAELVLVAEGDGGMGGGLSREFLPSISCKRVRAEAD